MKLFFTLLCSVFFGLTAMSQTADAKAITPDPDQATLVVDVSCGKCKFGMAGKSCDMAVKIDGKAYYVDGADMDNYGDAHAHDGMCNIIRKAEVQGNLVDNRYKISYIKLLPIAKEEIKQ